MAGKKNVLLPLVWNIVKASLVTFGSMFIGTLVISWLAKDIESRTVINFLYDLFLMAAYAVFFYRFHMYPRIVTYTRHREDFDVRAEAAAFIRAEGYLLVIFYGVCAVLMEVVQIIPSGAVSFIGTVFTDISLGAVWTGIPVPVLRAVLAFAYACGMSCLLALFRSRKIYKEELAEQAKREGR